MPQPPAGSNDIAATPPKVDAPPADVAAAPAPAEPATPPATTEPAPAATPPAAGAAQDYVIVKGDTYWALAEKFLGDPFKWPEIQAANPDLKPEDLPIGGALKIPAKS